MTAKSVGSSFIFQDPQNPLIVRVNGKATGIKSTDDGRHQFVQLRQARTEESGFSWNVRPGESVVQVHDVVIFDDMDVNCLLWLMAWRVQLCFSNVEPPFSIHPRKVVDLINDLNDYQRQFADSKVLPGSVIYLPNTYQNPQELERLQRLETALKIVGFQTVPTYTTSVKEQVGLAASSTPKPVEKPPFIAQDPKDPSIIEVNGQYAPASQKFDDGYQVFVQFARVDRYLKDVSTIKLNGVVIYDPWDVGPLLNLLKKNVQICFSEEEPSFSIHPQLVGHLAEELEDFHQQCPDAKVLPGSVIHLPDACGSLSELDRSQRLELALKAVGFETVPNRLR